jgi:hypothetical protein
MNPGELERLGEPDLVIAGLRVWVHGRQFPQAVDYWDGNWRHCGAAPRFAALNPILRLN